MKTPTDTPVKYKTPRKMYQKQKLLKAFRLNSKLMSPRASDHDTQSLLLQRIKFIIF